MNFFGKTLIVLQLFLSLLFLCFAGAVYQFQAQWQEKATKAQEQIATLQQTANRQTADIENERTQHDIAINSLTGERDSISIDRTRAVEEQNRLEAQLAEVRQERDKALAENERATSEAGSRREESLTVNQNISALRAANAEQMERIRDRENENLDMSTALSSAAHREELHLEEMGRLKSLLRANGVDPSDELPGTVPTIAERVEGIVERRLENDGRNQEFVQLSIGSDDKIEKNMILTVYRGAEFVCDVRVYKVDPDKAVGIVIENTRRDNVLEGDHVTTKL